MINVKIKPLCKDIITSYTHYVRDQVSLGRLEYIETGIDNDIDVYKNLFLEMLSLAIGVKDIEPSTNKVVKDETIQIIKRELSRSKYRKILTNYRLLIYTTCERIFEMVMEGIANEVGQQ